MTQHTPGPWNVVNTNDDRRRLQIHSNVGPVIVALVPNVDERDITGITKESETNARLIAAAPEMLALLKSVPPINGSDAQAEMEWNWKLEALLSKIDGKEAPCSN